MAQGRRWAEAAGAVVTDEGDAAGVEVSPLMSYVSHGYACELV
jgi:UDP-N-acetylglucosamine/UDP-N-acetylgalactosamine diphosphorylase